MKVEGEQFYLARFPDNDYLFTDKSEAIDKLKENGEGIDTDAGDEISIVEVDYEEDDWSIMELPWQQIALQLLNE